MTKIEKEESEAKQERLYLLYMQTLTLLREAESRNRRCPKCGFHHGSEK